MLTEEIVKLWKERIPSASLFGFMVGGAGIIMLILTKKGLTDEFIRMTKGYFDKRDSSSFNKANKWITQLTLAFLCLSALIILMGFFSSGDIRARFFRGPKARIIGVLAIGVLMALTLGLICCWMRHAEFYVHFHKFSQGSQYECVLSNDRYWQGYCMYMSSINLILQEKKLEDYKLCDKFDKYRFCELFLPLLSVHFFKIFLSFCVIIIGHAIYCMDLAANYIKIRCQAKFQELEDLRSLEFEISSKGTM